MWTSLLADYDLDDAGGLSLLRAACEAFDRAQQARRLVKSTGGPLLKDRFGQVKPNPGVSIERDARAQLIAALKAMRLEANA